MRFAILGAGIAGITSAKILQNNGHEVVVYERNKSVGGLIRCEKIEGNLYHKIGGHVFNSKHEDVLDWFWKHFDRDLEFIKTTRNAQILLNNKFIGYPIENFLYQLETSLVKQIVTDILEQQKQGYKEPNEYGSFRDFLIGNFGITLYELYFKPYNQKIWQTDLDNVSLDWLEGKLPMPNYVEMLSNSILREAESNMVHSSFYYPKNNGSQFIADRISEGLDIRLNKEINFATLKNNKWIIEDECFDGVIYTGDVRFLNKFIKNIPSKVADDHKEVANLKVHGTSNILCYLENYNDLSWLYLPEKKVLAHRIIFTGNFSENNNKDKNTCVVEFTGSVSEEKMKEEIEKLPGNLKAITSNYEANTYVIQDKNTRKDISKLKETLKPYNFYLHGRFAEWEYYNMDSVIKAGLDEFSSI
jgi:protoporphyrinogen oxidase